MSKQVVSIEPIDDNLADVDVINNIVAKQYKAVRNRSKAPTFALTYQGTFKTLMVNLGFSEEEAKSVEKGYHDLYKVSDDYTKHRLEQASKDGYVTVCFGLRLRTPRLGVTLYGHKRTPQGALREGRTAGNAFGQSYCMLTIRSVTAFINTVLKTKYKTSILPCLQIHDAGYFLIKEDPKLLHFVNRLFIKEMGWQDDPAIQSDNLHLESELSLFYPSWKEEHTIPNDISLKDMEVLFNEIIKPELS